jgi:putative Mg2+ transporter-C (MgtC) family protein
MEAWLGIEPLRAAPLGEVALRLAAAVVLAGLIGLDREVRHKPVGLKTLMLVALGAAAFCTTASEMIARAQMGESFAHAPDRVIQGIIAGIGFLGAGAIIQDGARVRGVTTGATIWVAGGIGIASGFGIYLHAALVTGITLLVLTLVSPLERHFLPGEKQRAEEEDQVP